MQLDKLNINSINFYKEKFTNTKNKLLTKNLTGKEKYIRALWREIKVRDALEKIAQNQANFNQNSNNKIESFFTKEEIFKLQSIFSILIDKNGNLKNRPERRLEIDELKLLVKFQRYFVKCIQEELKDTSHAKLKHLFNFMNDKGKFNEASLVGKTIKESKIVTLPTTFFSGIILATLTALGATFAPYIAIGLTTIALGVFCYKVAKRIMEKNGFGVSDLEVFPNMEGKIPNIFDIETKTGSSHMIKVAEKMQDIITEEIVSKNLLFDKFEDFTITSSVLNDLEGKKKVLGLKKTNESKRLLFNNSSDIFLHI
jgi:hypothetical protein